MVLNIVDEGLSRKLQHRSLTDELTGADSRRGLRERAPRAIVRAAAAGHAMALLMVDLDHFKRIADEHGHITGDDVLREATRRMQHCLRSDALLARYGGEEFCAVVPVADLGVARTGAERLRETISGTDCPCSTGPVRVTASVDLSLLGLDESFEEALRRADAALYRAKKGGRNRVEVMFGSRGVRL